MDQNSDLFINQENILMTKVRPLRIFVVSIPAIMLCTYLSSCTDRIVTDDDLAPFKRQTLEWKVCDPTIVPADYADILKQLGDRARCAGMRAPIDYTDTARGEIVVELLKVSAGQPATRLGAILLNPGGPGGDGLFLAPLYALLWSGANPQDNTGALYRQMSERYDLVGFSPRGTGASTRLYCGSNEQLKFTANNAMDRSPENIAAMLYNGQLEAGSCRKNPLTPFINTDATARDMDLIRHLLGDEKINYLGWSYGSWLGSWYATILPDRVGRMMLIGNMDITGYFNNNILLQNMAMQRVLDDILAPYAARHPDMFVLGDTADIVRQVYRELPMDLQPATGQKLASTLGNSAVADTSLLTLRAAQVLKGLIQTHPEAGKKEMSGFIASAYFVPRPDMNEKARLIAESLNEGYFANVSRNPPGPVNLAGGDATYWAVVCNDTEMGFDVDGWIREENQVAVSYPLQGGSATEMPCLYWGGPSVARPPLEIATHAGGIVMMQSQYDALTATEGAMRSFDALTNASLIQLDGEYTHGVDVPYGVDCVDLPVAEYYLYGVQPIRQANCPGKKLSADALPAAGGGLASAVEKSSTLFIDPLEAERIAKMISAIINVSPVRSKY